MRVRACVCARGDESLIHPPSSPGVKKHDPPPLVHQSQAKVLQRTLVSV